jgi:hypothetical protein
VAAITNTKRTKWFRYPGTAGQTCAEPRTPRCALGAQQDWRCVAISSMNRDYWTKKRREAEAELGHATARTSVKAGAEWVMQATADALGGLPGRV